MAESICSARDASSWSCADSRNGKSRKSTTWVAIQATNVTLRRPSRTRVSTSARSSGCTASALLRRRRLRQTEQVGEQQVCTVGAGRQLTPQTETEIDPATLAYLPFDERTELLTRIIR